MIKFPWTKRIEKLEKNIVTIAKNFDSYRDHQFNINKDRLKNLNTLRQALDDTLATLEKKEPEVAKEIEELKTQLNYVKNQYNEVQEAIKEGITPAVMGIKDKLGTELEDLKTRLGKAELMHAATSKKQNELFGDAMTQMIEVSSKVSIHIADLAEKRIKEITVARDIPDPDEFVLITMNGQPTKVRPGEMTYYDILDIYFYPYCERKKYTFCSITYKNGADEDKPSGTISKNETLLAKSGTVVNVTVVNVDDSR